MQMLIPEKLLLNHGSFLGEVRMKVKIGNIFDSDCKAIVNTVNCVGVMGKGIALEFKKK